MLQLPRGAEREYLVEYGLAAIYVAALPNGPTVVRTSRDLLHSLVALRRRWPLVRITCAYWVKDAAEARLICREVNRSLAHGSEGLLVATAKSAQRRVENVAAHMNIALTDHVTIMLRVRTAVDFVEQKIEEAQATGGLSWFNSSFRAWRLRAAPLGRSMSYSEARARLRRRIFRQILSNEFQSVSNYSEVVVPDLFPPLPDQVLN